MGSTLKEISDKQLFDEYKLRFHEKIYNTIKRYKINKSVYIYGDQQYKERDLHHTIRKAEKSETTIYGGVLIAEYISGESH